MKNNSKKTGTSTNGHIENINQVDPVICDCKKCFHSKNAAGTIYCNYYDLFSPHKTKCVRFSPSENYGQKISRKAAREAAKAKHTPTFPWEIP